MLLLLLFLFSSIFCTYKELSKYGSVEVGQPDTRVYLDITSFNTGDVISFEFKMDLFFAHFDEQERFIFQIGQVSVSSYADSHAWNNLPNVTNRNVTQENTLTKDDYIFTWDEIKQEGKNYIFVICPEPFDGFFSFWDKKIKINNLGGKGGTSGATIAIIIVVIFIVIIIVTIIVVCCRKRRNLNVTQTALYNAQIQQQYQQPIPLQQQQVIIQPSAIPQPYPYQQPIVYQDPNVIQQPNVIQPIIQPQINYGQLEYPQQAYPPTIEPNQVGQAHAPVQINQQKNPKNYSSSKMGVFDKPQRGWKK